MSSETVLCLGSNKGDRAWNLRQMERELAGYLGPRIVLSRLMETEPVGVTGDQPWFFNRLIRGVFDGTPRDLLRKCLDIETALGRTRLERGAPRTADIDILLFGGQQLKEPDLVIPHPRLTQRRFCLLGLREVAPDWTVPGFDKRVDQVTAEWEPRVRQQQVRFIDPSRNGKG